MDGRLLRAAERGDTEMLYSLLPNPNIFEIGIDDHPFGSTPLHIAASSNHHESDEMSYEGDDAARRMAEFAMELAILKPSFTRKLNSEGLTPMHLALLKGNWKTVRTLMTFDPELIRIKGKGGKTPLHVAAEVAPPQLLAELLFLCPSSVEDVTAQWKTAVHLAVEAERLESLRVLLGWLSKVEKEVLLYWKDIDGNTVLHLATCTNQIQVVKRLLNLMDDHVKNFKGETALAIHKNKNNLERNEEIGWALAAANNRLFRRQRNTLGNFLGHDLSKADLLNRRMRSLFAMVGWGNEKYREAIVVVAALVATATYQGVLSPPGGVWQDDSSSTNSTSNITTTAHSAGKMVMSGKWLSRFIRTNSMAFAISIALIFACMPGDIFFGSYLAICTVALLLTYQYAMHSILPPDQTSLVGQVNTMIIGAIVLASLFLYLRFWMAKHSAATLKLNTAERGLSWGLVRSDDDPNRQRNRHSSTDGHMTESNRFIIEKGSRAPEDP